MPRGSSTVYLSDLFRKYFIKVFSQFCSLKSLRPQVTREGKIIENTVVGISNANYIPELYHGRDFNHKTISPEV